MSATNLTAPLKCDFARSFDGKSCNQRQPLDTENWCEECVWNLQTEDFRAAINDERAIAAAVIRERDEAREKLGRTAVALATESALRVLDSKALADERAISAAAIRERDDLVKVLSSIRDEFDSTVIEAERPKGGMSVPFGGDFAGVVRLPSITARMRWWVQQFDAALARAKAGAR